MPNFRPDEIALVAARGLIAINESNVHLKNENSQLNLELQAAREQIDGLGQILADLHGGYVELPKDRNGRHLHVGDKVRILHNERVVTISGMDLRGEQWCVYPEEGGGAWLMPESESNVETVDG